VIHSAGSTPGEALNPAVVAVLAEWDIDITAEVPKKLTDEMAQDADVIVTMGCGDTLPGVSQEKTYRDWELSDPCGQVGSTRSDSIRDEIDHRVRDLLRDLTTDTSAVSPPGGLASKSAHRRSSRSGSGVRVGTTGGLRAQR